MLLAKKETSWTGAANFRFAACLALILWASTCVSVAGLAAETAKQESPACEKCLSIATEYADTWENLSQLLKEEADLEEQIVALSGNFRSAYFDDNQAAIGQWSKDSISVLERAPILLPKIAKARKEVDARHAELLECLRQQCLLEGSTSPVGDAGNEESCKPCIENANRVADLTARLVRLNAIATEMGADIKLRHETLANESAAHEENVLNPPLAVVQKSREFLTFVENQEDTLQDAIRVLKESLDESQKALEACRSAQCPANNASELTPPPRPSPPSCAKCDDLFAKIAEATEEVARLTRLRMTFENLKSDLDESAAKSVLKAADKSVLDAATIRLQSIDEELAARKSEIDELTASLDRCKNEPCEPEKPRPAAKATPPPEEPIKDAIGKALKNLGGKSSKKK